MFDWTLVSEVIVSDECTGLAEVVNVSGEIFYLRWITSTPCYDCMVFDDRHFKTVMAYPKEDILETKNIRLMDFASVIRLRRDSIIENQEINRLRKQLRTA